MICHLELSLSHSCLLQQNNALFLAKTLNFFYQICLKKLETILLSKVDPDSESELIDEDDSFHELMFDNLPYSSISDKVKYIRDGVVKKGELINLLLDPS